MIKKRLLALLLAAALTLTACGNSGISASELEAAGVFSALNANAAGETWTTRTYREPLADAEPQPLPEGYALSKPYYVLEYDRLEPFVFYGGQGQYKMTEAKAYGIGPKDAGYLTSGTVIFVFYEYGNPRAYKGENGEECLGVQQDASVYFYEIGSGAVYRGPSFEGAPLKQKYEKLSVKNFINQVNFDEIRKYIKGLLR